MIDVTLEADIEAVLGSSGSGKSAYIKGRLAREKPPRLLIYDPEGEYEKAGRVVTSLGEVLKVLEEAGDSKPFRIVFAPNADPGKAEKQFELLCRMAFHCGNLLFVVEELADVTTASRAPVGWSMLSRRGRKRGCRVIGASQRPASIDKTFFGNCTQVRCGRLLYEEDAKVMGKVLGVDHAELLALAPLHFVQRKPPESAQRGLLKFKGNNAYVLMRSEPT